VAHSRPQAADPPPKAETPNGDAPKPAGNGWTFDEARDRLALWTYLTPSANNPVGRMNAILADVIAAEPVERKLQKALKADPGKSHDLGEQLAAAEAAGAITAEERKLLERVRAATFEFISVDDFDPRELEAAVIRKRPLRSVA
jgi:acyl-CoA dehydrogenase